MLTRFGIKSTADALNGATVQNYLQKGNFQILFGILVGFAPPLDTLVGALVSYNFSSLGRGIGYNSNQTVPGLGKVNISKTLQKQFQTIGPGPQMDKLIAIWARFVNNKPSLPQHHRP